EVGVAGRVDDVELHVAVTHGGVLARIVMPFSRSRSVESSTRSLTSWLARNTPDCHNMASTNVVLPWSTWATMATLRRSLRAGMNSLPISRGTLAAYLRPAPPMLPARAAVLVGP